MSKRKNEDLMKSIMNQNFLMYNKDALKGAMMHQEVAGQRVFYVFLKQHGYDINPEDMDKCQSDGIIGNCIIECKLNSEKGGGPKKAFQELYSIIPNRLKSKGLRVPYYRIYVELETFFVEVYTWDSYKKIDSFDWYESPENFKKYFEDTTKYEYDLSEDSVDLVEVIQNIYEEFSIKDKLEAYKILESGVKGWFKPFDIKRCNVNKLILNNDKMNEKYVQKVQGAFFTPSQYVKISTEYVMKAIEESKKDGYDDYVIIDRCAGVGNLESMFPIDTYSHMILGTINEAEALTANIRFNGLCEVVVQDALSREGVLLYRDKIEEYKNKNKVKKLAVIFLENPPYFNVTNTGRNGDKSKNDNTEKHIKTYVQSIMTIGAIDLDEQFIWSCFNIYTPYAYVHYGPMKSWKSKHLFDKEVKSAYLCNRKYFNATESSIALLWLSNKDKDNKYIDFDSEYGKYRVKKVYKSISELLPNPIENGFLKLDVSRFSSQNQFLHCLLSNCGKNNNINENNILEIMPLFCVGFDEYSCNGKSPYNDKVDFRIIDTVYRCSDGGNKYQKDTKFLQDCLVWSLCCNKHNIESDNKFYKVAEELLDEDHKSTEIYKLYRELVDSTHVNGLKNIEKYKTEEYGKLYIEGTFGPTISKLKKLLSIYQYEVIRPNMLKYELLK